MRTALRTIRRFCYELTGGMPKSDILRALPTFTATSVGSLKDHTRLALQCAQQVFPLLVELAEITENKNCDIKSINEIFPDADDLFETKSLAELFRKYGSDKSSRHDYHLLYGPLLALIRTNRIRLLEIGLGTNNEDIISTMGKGGKPGASLRAFRDFLPQSDIYGADIDSRILFTEDRIKTAFADQTNPKTLNKMMSDFGGQFDIIIDDGLHAPNANLASMIEAITQLRPRGKFIAEDISPAAVPFWQIVSCLLPSNYNSTLIKTKTLFMFMITKPET